MMNNIEVGSKVRYFKKVVETDNECLCNDKPPQIGVYFYSIEIP